MSEHRETLGMLDVLESYPVPGPQSLDGLLGFRLLEVGDGFARGEAPYADRICQRFGLVHGGAYAALAEMVASEATVHHVWESGRRAMGMSNNTNFMRPITGGTIHAEARTLSAGRSTWVWDVSMSDDDGRRCAVAIVTIAVRPR
jgi:1,4-dihydroxy-2-naphthoyl-CoA hydrolase